MAAGAAAGGTARGAGGGCSTQKSSQSKFTSWAIAQAEYETMIKKKLLYSPGYQYDTILSPRLVGAIYQREPPRRVLGRSGIPRLPADEAGQL